MDYKAEDIITMIRNRYDSREWVVIEQVADATGMYQRRWVDAAAFSLWPSKGLTRAAFEVKVCRADFIHELQNAVKHKWCRESFHEFWFVGPKEIFQEVELPEGVGLMCPRGNKLTIRTHCRRNDSPVLDDSLLAAFMRGAAKEIERFKKCNEQDMLDQSLAYQRALTYEAAAKYFCECHGVTLLDRAGDNKEDVLARLESAITDDQIKKDREQLLYIAGRFQREVCSLINLVAIVAHKGILARDDLGRNVIKYFGGEDEDSLEVIKKTVKKWNSNPYAKTIEILLNWDKEFGESK